MKLSVGEMAKLTGVSVRTLHYYGQIGLLCPETAVGSGYRWYGEADVERMQQILFFRELDFPLRDIQAILADPQYDKQEALRRQRRLLQMKRDRLDRLLELLEANLKGEQTMEFKGFDAAELEAARRRYADEAKARWGGCFFAFFGGGGPPWRAGSGSNAAARRWASAPSIFFILTSKRKCAVHGGKEKMFSVCRKRPAICCYFHLYMVK